MASKHLTRKSGNRSETRFIFDPLKFVRKLAAARPTKLSGMVRRMQPAELISIEINPADYSSVDEFRHDYLLKEVLRKYDSFDLPIDRKQVAIDNLVFHEHRIGKLNQDWHTKGTEYIESLGVPLSFVLERAARKMAYLLGEFSPDRVLDGCGFSHGASFTCSRDKSQPSHKYEMDTIDVTKEALPFFDLAVSQIPLWNPSYRLVPGNKIEVVPKSSKTDRTIGIEPTANMWLQRGVGSHIRKRLKRLFGICLDTGHERNARASYEGSLLGTVATIDLAAASDSISIALARTLLPWEWFLYLMAIRSDRGRLPDGSWIQYEKLSSMGNGYTFELESAIFLCITQSCAEFLEGEGAGAEHLVFGDDIVVPSTQAQCVCDVLSKVGFATNDDKTFVDGPFRESCGSHYFQGISVKPFYIRTVPKFVDRINLINKLKCWMVSSGHYDYRYQPALEYLLSSIPPKWRRPRLPLGPIAVGDCAVVGLPSEITYEYCKRYPWVYRPEVIRQVRQQVKAEGIGGLLHWFQQTSNRTGCITGAVEVFTPLGRVRTVSSKQFVPLLPTNMVVRGG
uniref:RNA-directed RNA polymerase n=1 Tax=Beihai levi-like virus 19 TaxID=1922404 RepID=A0A1L3KI44_9VIRU|nr:hypothetical protein [Beihai levi-like virus 19]